MKRFFAENSRHGRLHGLALLAAWGLQAQAWAQAADTDPMPVQTPVYRSVFAQYQGFTDAAPAPWPAANDTVRAAGGWRAYAKEAAHARAVAQTGGAEAAPRTPQGPSEPAKP